MSTARSLRSRAGSRTRAPGYGWPLGRRTWVNPSPNAPNLWMARCYAGTVMLEGTTLSEGRGTTRPLELFGAPDLDVHGAARGHARARAGVDARLPAAAVLVRAHLPQARGQAVRRSAGPRRGRGLLRPRGVPAVAAVRARVQGAAAPAPDYPLWRGLPLRVRARPARDRRDQRQRPAAALGRRSGGDPGRSRSARGEGTRPRGAPSGRRTCCTEDACRPRATSPATASTGPQRFGTAPFLPMSRAEMDALGWDSCDVILVTGDAYVDHPSFGMAIIGRVLEAQGFRVGIIAQPDWHSAEPFAALGRPNLFFGITAGNMDSMVNRYTADRRVRSDDAYTPGGVGGKRPDRSRDRLRAARARGVQATCRSSSAASRHRCAASRTSTTGRRRCAARSCSTPRRTCWCTATASAQICRDRAPPGRAARPSTSITDLRGTAFVRKRHAARAGSRSTRRISMRPGRVEPARRSVRDGAELRRRATRRGEPRGAPTPAAEAPRRSCASCAA